MTSKDSSTSSSAQKKQQQKKKQQKKSSSSSSSSNCSRSSSKCDLHKQMATACTKLDCGVHEFQARVHYPVHIKVKRPRCINNKQAQSSSSRSTCDEKWISCPADINFCVNENFKERMGIPVEFKVKRPICEKKKNRKQNPIKSSTGTSKQVKQAKKQQAQQAKQAKKVKKQKK